MKPQVDASKRDRDRSFRTRNSKLETRNSKLGIGLVGCGRVGTATALGLKQAGHRIVWVKDIDPKAERKAEHLLLRRQRARSKEQRAKTPLAVDVILIATPDSQIAAASREIADSLSPSQTVVHFSGALTSQTIQNPKSKIQNPGVLALHPVMTFPKCGIRVSTTKSPRHQGARKERIDGNRWESVDGVTTECGIPKGTYFSLEGNRKGLDVGKRLVRDLGGRAFVVRAEDKPLFHAACVFVSNFLDALVDAGIELCKEVGIERAMAYRVLEPLIQQTLKNIAKQDTAQALSGPIERGDVDTVRKHLAAITRRRPELVQLYEALAGQTLALAARKLRGRKRQ